MPSGAMAWMISGRVFAGMTRISHPARSRHLKILYFIPKSNAATLCLPFLGGQTDFCKASTSEAQGTG